ncbi:hypothetical protein ONR57_06195 [Hoyosella sp. YIM 151337]|uniref:hypothetical protein n=1 Tax=Hoyosella sp. YIM 151337 TaxID=2992742 RepID=UPI002236A630|nr:hypothetical protein [Hoyosella sp. YIM 151337]MCW4352883.1 hypothetical protein [Hoyosella sp. YIM 151337]
MAPAASSVGQQPVDLLIAYMHAAADGIGHDRATPDPAEANAAMWSDGYAAE